MSPSLDSDLTVMSMYPMNEGPIRTRAEKREQEAQRQRMKRIDRHPTAKARVLEIVDLISESSDLDIPLMVAYREELTRALPYLHIRTMFSEWGSAELKRMTEGLIADLKLDIEGKRGLLAEEVRRNRQHRRDERLASRPVGISETPTRLCSVCQKKPARVDDLCKRCAHAAGILVHGKIGAGV